MLEDIVLLETGKVSSENEDEQENKLKDITFYDCENKRFRQIDLHHYHRIDGKAEKPHVQAGYLHNGEASKPTEKNRRLIDKVLKKWYSK